MSLPTTKNIMDCVDGAINATKREEMYAYKEAAALAIKQLEDAIPVWVPVAERMPPSGLPVLAYFTNELGNGRRARAEWIAQWAQLYEGDADPEEVGCEEDPKGDWYIQQGWYESPLEAEESYRLSGVVTHWMPLPPPPESRDVEGRKA